MELTLEQRATAIAMVEYLKEQGYILAPAEREELAEYRELKDGYVSGKEAAKMIGCFPSYIVKLKDNKVLKYRMVGSHPRYSVKSIQEYLKKRTIG
jgi:hypothetical protein